MKSRTNFDPNSYWERRLGSEFSLKGVGFTTLGRRYNEWMYKVRREVFPRVVRELPVDVAQSRVLDVGSGTGFYIGLWRELGVRDLMGVDLTQAAVEGLRRQFPGVRFEQLDIGEPLAPTDALADASFDLLSCCDVLYHVVDDDRYRQAIANIGRLLAPGGYFLYSDNFLHGPSVRIRHQVSRSITEIEDALDAAGLEPVRRVPVFVIMNTPLDSPSRTRRLTWSAMMRALTLTEPTGWLTGAALYPIERRLVRTRTESPTTELMVCRRRP